MRRLFTIVLALGVAASAPASGTTGAGAAGTNAIVGYDFFQVASQADGARVYFNIDGFLPVEPILSVTTSTTEAFLESSRSTALAVLPNPGDVVRSAPGLAGGLLAVPNLPGYPAARATHPTQPDADVVLGPDTAAGRIVAHADDSVAWSEARLGGVGRSDSGLANLAVVSDALGGFLDPIVAPLGAVLGGDTTFDGPLLRLEGARTSAESRADDAVSFRAVAETEYEGISLLGGLIRISGFRSFAEAAFENGEARAGDHGVEVGAVEILGQEAAITEDGLELTGAGGVGLDDVVAPVLKQLADQGFEVTVTPGHVVSSKGTAVVTAGTLKIRTVQQYQGYDAPFEITFGSATAAVAALGPRTPRVFTPSPPLSSFTPPGPSPTVAGASISGVTSPASSATVPVSRPNGPFAAPVAAPAPVAVISGLGRAYGLIALLAISLVASRALPLLGAMPRRRRDGLDELFTW